jgi:hypothetical protein
MNVEFEIICKEVVVADVKKYSTIYICINKIQKFVTIVH